MNAYYIKQQNLSIGSKKILKLASVKFSKKKNKKTVNNESKYHVLFVENYVESVYKEKKLILKLNKHIELFNYNQNKFIKKSK